MDKNDLIFPLDANFRPFNPVKELISRFYDALDKLIENSILFDVVETHFGVTYKHDLQNIVRWSRRDLEMTGIDFTSNYKEALEYADCWQGSQLKQNIKTISDYLISNKENLQLISILSEIELANIYEINKWVNIPRSPKPIVIHLKRSFDGFREFDKILPLGTKEQFKAVIRKYLNSSETNNRDQITSLLPKENDEFCCSVIKPILATDILHIEEVCKTC